MAEREEKKKLKGWVCACVWLAVDGPESHRRHNVQQKKVAKGKRVCVKYCKGRVWEEKGKESNRKEEGIKRGGANGGERGGAKKKVSECKKRSRKGRRCMVRSYVCVCA